MKIAVIGAGKIGGTLGGKWEQSDHEVVFGLRDPSKKKGAQSIGAALDAADTVLLAIPGDAVVAFVRDNARALDGCDDRVAGDRQQQLPRRRHELVGAVSACGAEGPALPRVQLLRVGRLCRSSDRG